MNKDSNYIICAETKTMTRFLLFSLLLVMLFNARSAAREKCVLSPESAPALLNLALGDSPAQARNSLNNKFGIKNKTKGEYTFFQNFIKDRPPAFLTGIRAFYLRFFDGRLYQIEFFYEKQNRFATLKDFINFQTMNLNIPAELWKIEYGIAGFDCGGFTVEADNFLNPRIEITDEIIRREVEREREKGN